MVHLDDLLGTAQLLAHLAGRVDLGLATGALEADLAGFRRHVLPRLRRTRRRKDA